MVLIRYADVLMRYAKTLIELNRNTDAAVYINNVRHRQNVMMPTLQALETVRGETIIADQVTCPGFLPD